MDLGIIGLGRLGSMVANYGSACGMRVRYYDPLVGGIANYKRAATMTELVSQSDVVTLHVPHEKDTELLLDSRVLTAFRYGSIFINTSRGELVDHDALLECLKSGQIGGAALDVLEGEFIPGFSVEKHPLWNYAEHHQNIILTPHIGGSTQDAWYLTEEYTISKVIKYLDNQRNCLND
jgi:D-3-phosphoglycerate dehydrogenase